MQTATEAEEHLRVIRSLMEKATIYRAISAPTALVGGLCSTIFGAGLYFRWRAQAQEFVSYEFGRLFCVGWLVVLVVTVAANAHFIWLAARRRNDPFISPAMRKALWALFPPVLCGAYFTVASTILRESVNWDLSSLWMVFYGLGLLATAQFAPRSIPVLGWFFLFAGFLTLGIDHWHRLRGSEIADEYQSAMAANLFMVGTFGLFHLVYAACTWPRGARSTVSRVTP